MSSGSLFKKLLSNSSRDASSGSLRQPRKPFACSSRNVLTGPRSQPASGNLSPLVPLERGRWNDMSDLRPQLASSGSLNKLNPFTNKLVQCSRLNASHDDFDKIPSPIAALRRSAFKRAAAQLKALCVQASGCSIESEPRRFRQDSQPHPSFATL